MTDHRVERDTSERRPRPLQLGRLSEWAIVSPPCEGEPRTPTTLILSQKGLAIERGMRAPVLGLSQEYYATLFENHSASSIEGPHIVADTIDKKRVLATQWLASYFDGQLPHVGFDKDGAGQILAELNEDRRSAGREGLATREEAVIWQCMSVPAQDPRWFGQGGPDLDVYALATKLAFLTCETEGSMEQKYLEKLREAVALQSSGLEPRLPEPVMKPKVSYDGVKYVDIHDSAENGEFVWPNQKRWGLKPKDQVALFGHTPALDEETLQRVYERKLQLAAVYLGSFLPRPKRVTKGELWHWVFRSTLLKLRRGGHTERHDPDIYAEVERSMASLQNTVLFADSSQAAQERLAYIVLLAREGTGGSRVLEDGKYVKTAPRLPEGLWDNDPAQYPLERVNRP